MVRRFVIIFVGECRVILFNNFFVINFGWAYFLFVIFVTVGYPFSLCTDYVGEGRNNLMKLSWTVLLIRR